MEILNRHRRVKSKEKNGLAVKFKLLLLIPFYYLISRPTRQRIEQFNVFGTNLGGKVDELLADIESRLQEENNWSEEVEFCSRNSRLMDSKQQTENDVEIGQESKIFRMVFIFRMAMVKSVIQTEI